MYPAFAGRTPVCMKCRDGGIRQQAIGDGLWPGGGEGIAWVCDACGHIGAPLLLDPEGTTDDEIEPAWEQEYERAAQGIETETERPRERHDREARARGLRLQALSFFILAAIFLAPPLVLLTETLSVPHWTNLPGVLGYILGQTWLFIGVGTVLLVMAMRKTDAAAQIDKEHRGDRADEAL